MMKRVCVRICVSLALATGFAVVCGSPSVPAQTPPAPTQMSPASDSQQRGWLEGLVTNPQGQPIWGATYPQGIHVKGVRHSGGEFDVQTDLQMGGLYSARELRPGIYDITLAKGYISSTAYCPQRIFSVMIRPGVRTILNIRMDQGETLEETGKPLVATESVVFVSAELARLQQQIDDLKQQLAALQAKLPAADTGPKK